MSPSEIDELLDQGPSCPSSMALDQLELGHLPPTEAEQTQKHVAGCARCQQRVEHRRQQTMGLSEVSARRILSGLKEASRQEPPTSKTLDAFHKAVHGVDAEARTRLVPLEGEQTDAEARTRLVPLDDQQDQSELGQRRRRKQIWKPFAAVVAIAAAAAVVFLVVRVDRSKGPVVDDRDVVRVMGGIKLIVIRKRGDQVSETVSGDTFLAGDQVRFRVTPSGPGQVMIVGVESDGKSYMAYPSEGAEESRPISGTEAVLLPGAVELDDSPRTEWLHLVHCPQPFSRRQLVIDKGSPDKIAVPKGCGSDTFEMRKAPPASQPK